jgi:hypothetical protein
MIKEVAVVVLRRPRDHSRRGSLYRVANSVELT